MILKSINFLIFPILVLCTNVLFGQVSADKYLNPIIKIHQDSELIVASVIPCTVSNPLSDRNYYWSTGNQINKTQGGFSGKLLNGAYNVFYDNKNLKESGEYKKGLQSGIWKYWNAEGVLLKSSTFIDGFKHGIESVYDSLGNVHERNRYYYGQYHGEQLKYQGDSTLIRKFKYGIPQALPAMRKKKFLFF